jgi:hypothetical protein
MRMAELFNSSTRCSGAGAAVAKLEATLTSNPEQADMDGLPRQQPELTGRRVAGGSKYAGEKYGEREVAPPPNMQRAKVPPCSSCVFPA